jgi:hypothetical protein
VPTDKNRDRAVDRMLQTMRAAEPDAGSARCIDAETLAAWSSGTLSRKEAAAVEAHAANCARCQAMASAFARMEPPAAVRPGFLVGWRLSSVLPLAAAAAVLAIAVIWTLTPRSARPGPTLMASRDARPPSAAAPPADSAPSSGPATGPGRTDPSTSALRSGPSGRSVAAPPAAQPPGVSSTARSSAALADNRAAAGRPDASSKSAALSRGAPPAAVPGRADATPPSTAASGNNNVMIDGISPTDAAAPARSQPSEPESVPLRTPASPAIQAQSGERSFAANPAAPSASPVQIIEFASPAMTAGTTAGFARAGRAGVAGAAAPLPAAPASGTRWRILPAQVQRSVDDGQTWDVIAIDPRAVLLAGSAPSRLVCWLVGRNGAVLVSSDALHFTRLPFPQDIDLVGVTATDNRRAIVTAADGRTFGTTDGGLTWTGRP